MEEDEEKKMKKKIKTESAMNGASDHRLCLKFCAHAWACIFKFIATRFIITMESAVSRCPYRILSGAQT